MISNHSKNLSSACLTTFFVVFLTACGSGGSSDGGATTQNNNGQNNSGLPNDSSSSSDNSNYNISSQNISPFQRLEVTSDDAIPLGEIISIDFAGTIINPILSKDRKTVVFSAPLDQESGSHSVRLLNSDNNSLASFDVYVDVESGDYDTLTKAQYLDVLSSGDENNIRLVGQALTRYIYDFIVIYAVAEKISAKPESVLAPNTAAKRVHNLLRLTPKDEVLLKNANYLRNYANYLVGLTESNTSSRFSYRNSAIDSLGNCIASLKNDGCSTDEIANHYLEHLASNAVPTVLAGVVGVFLAPAIGVTTAAGGVLGAVGYGLLSLLNNGTRQVEQASRSSFETSTSYDNNSVSTWNESYESISSFEVQSEPANISKIYAESGMSWSSEEQEEIESTLRDTILDSEAENNTVLADYNSSPENANQTDEDNFQSPLNDFSCNSDLDLECLYEAVSLVEESVSCQCREVRNTELVCTTPGCSIPPDLVCEDRTGTSCTLTGQEEEATKALTNIVGQIVDTQYCSAFNNVDQLSMDEIERCGQYLEGLNLTDSFVADINDIDSEAENCGQGYISLSGSEGMNLCVASQLSAGGTGSCNIGFFNLSQKSWASGYSGTDKCMWYARDFIRSDGDGNQVCKTNYELQYVPGVNKQTCRLATLPASKVAAYRLDSSGQKANLYY